MPGGVHADAQHGDGLTRLRQVHRGIQVDDRDGRGESAQVRALEALHIRGRDREALVAPQDPAQDLAGRGLQRHEAEDAVVPGQGVAVGRIAERAGPGRTAAPGGEPLDPRQVDRRRDAGGAVLAAPDTDPHAQAAQNPHLVAAPLRRGQCDAGVRAATQNLPHAGGQRLQGDAGAAVVVGAAVGIHGRQVLQAVQGLGGDLSLQVPADDGPPGDALLDPPALAREQREQTQSSGPAGTGVLCGDLDRDRAPGGLPSAQHVGQTALPVRVTRRGGCGGGPTSGGQDQGRRVLAAAPHGARAAPPPVDVPALRLGEDHGLVDPAPRAADRGGDDLAVARHREVGDPTSLRVPAPPREGGRSRHRGDPDVGHVGGPVVGSDVSGHAGTL